MADLAPSRPNRHSSPEAPDLDACLVSSTDLKPGPNRYCSGGRIRVDLSPAS